MPDPANRILSRYAPVSGAFDEMLDEVGKVRPHWKILVEAFDRLGREELTARWENARRMIREHGVTYNVYGDPQGMDRPWELDMMPLPIPPEEWLRLEQGLKQRTRLLNLVLGDLYGPQRLLREGFLPPSLIFANPSFLRPCHGLRSPGDVYLHLHAVDLARSPSGQWWALADRTQAPSGSGYALENRIVLSRVLPDEFRDCQVQRLASFFQMSRDTLRSLATGNHDNPNVVLLTPGPHNETYFEHAYLARYLGFTLVEGGDLTVRDRRVFIKTLEGLQQVDVILRRVDDTFCDPLELRGDSFLGVPGLVEAARAGNVTIANALGSGLVESPAFMAFLPSLCRHLLEEELILPSVATWWCGQAKEQQYVIEHLDEIVVKPAFGTVRGLPFFGEQLGSSERAELVAMIRQRPHEFVGQEKVGLSTVPVWSSRECAARRVVVRSYIAATGDSFAVMPGGLTRVSTGAEDPVVSMQSGGGSKDTWVLSEGPVLPVSLLSSAGQPIGVTRVNTELPSRVADNLFWLGRYAERLEDALRLYRCLVTRIVDEGTGEGVAGLAGMIRWFVRLERLPARFEAQVTLKELEHAVLQGVYSPHRVGSVREIVLRIRHTASIVRDRFSTDTWRILNQLQLDSRTRAGRIPMANALSLLNTLIIDLAAFSGMELENMTRGHGWRFLDFGRRLERGMNLVSTIRAGLDTGGQSLTTLESLLEVADSSMTYRRRFFAQAQLAPVLELLLFDKGNPRSLLFQLNSLRQHAANLPTDPNASFANPEQQRILALVRHLEDGQFPGLCSDYQGGHCDRLLEWLDFFPAEFSRLSNDLTQHYFSHTVARVS